MKRMNGLRGVGLAVLAWGLLATGASAWGQAPGSVATSHTLTAAQKPINALALSPDGALLAASSQDGQIYVWKTAAIGPPTVLKPTKGNGAMYAVSFSADGSRIASADSSAMTVWSVGDGAVVYTQKQWPVHCHALSPAGTHLLYATRENKEEQLRFVSLESGANVWSQVSKEAVQSVVFSPDGAVIAALTGERFKPKQTVTLHDAKTGDVLRSMTYGGAKGIFSMAFSPDSKTLLLAGSEDRELHEVATGKKTASFAREKSPVALSRDNGAQFLADGKTIALNDQLQSVIWIDAATGKLLRTFKNDTRFDGRYPVVSPDGKRMMAVVGERFVNVWDLPATPAQVTFARTAGAFDLPFASYRNSKDHLVLQGSLAAVINVAWSADSKTLYTTTLDNRLNAWDVATGKRLLEIPTAAENRAQVATIHGGLQLVLSPDGFLFDSLTGKKADRPFVDSGLANVVASANGSRVVGISKSYPAAIEVWDVAPRNKVRSFKPAGFVTRLSLSADGSTLAYLDEGTVEIYSMADGRMIGTRSEKDATEFALSPDGKILAAAVFDKLYFWDIAEKKIIHETEVRGVNGIAWYPNGSAVAAYSAIESSAWLFMLSDGKRVPLTVEAVAGTAQPAFSPDGSMLALPNLDRVTLVPFTTKKSD